LIAARINKTPKHKYKPSKKKSPRVHCFTDTNQQTISWQFGKLDMNGDWCCKQIDRATLWDFLFERIKNFETMTWCEILVDKDNNHDVEKKNLSPEARKRLVQIRQDDIDSLFTLHLSGLRRLWGIRDGRALQVLWYDPKHKVCPSLLKHT
jgi:hypothetical protein